MRPRLVLFGDSITELSFASGGWGAALTDRFARQADVVLRGLSGYNTRWALKVLPRAMEGAAGAGAGADPAAVTVFFGANDASLPDQVQAHQHVPLKEYQSNLRAICAYFKVMDLSWIRMSWIGRSPIRRLGSSIAGAMALHCCHTHHSPTDLRASENPVNKY
ncbi:Isoamyl acetate-hydrolyzing esterase [Zea mays]|uniref:Isoamyl acetate-hydrolyzing esterase n=1 Tax=Zea mays TaxID=4577 RepID=A0A1D6MFY9_MAIZE|nr:Isoamyl acetate-hydrolyzing esterase [Zea mays]